MSLYRGHFYFLNLRLGSDIIIKFISVMIVAKAFQNLITQKTFIKMKVAFIISFIVLIVTIIIFIPLRKEIKKEKKKF
jgi:hypothetical protein